jgi:hypothetical protein
MDTENFDRDVRREIYDVTMREGTPPLAARLSETLRAPLAEVHASLQRLAGARMIALQRDEIEILMAGPFSAVPTPFRVRAGGIDCYGNCIWDALGIPAMLQSDADIDTSCADCGTSASIRIRNAQLEGEGLMHFAVPARQWWKDVVFT